MRAKCALSCVQLPEGLQYAYCPFAKRCLLNKRVRRRIWTAVLLPGSVSVLAPLVVQRCLPLPIPCPGLRPRTVMKHATPMRLTIHAHSTHARFGTTTGPGALTAGGRRSRSRGAGGQPGCGRAAACPSHDRGLHVGQADADAGAWQATRGRPWPVPWSQLVGTHLNAWEDIPDALSASSCTWEDNEDLAVHQDFPFAYITLGGLSKSVCCPIVCDAFLSL
jgi:hypothetical protein